MTKNIKILLAVLIGVPLLLYLGYQYNVDRVRQIANQYGLGYYTGVRRISYVQQRSPFVAVTWSLNGNKMEDEAIKASEIRSDNISSISLGSKYAVRSNVRLKYSGISGLNSSRGREDYWTLDIYKLSNLSDSPRTIDVFSDLQTETSAVVASVSNDLLVNSQGQEVLVITFFNQDKDKYFKVINLETLDITSPLSYQEVFNSPESYSSRYDSLYNLLNGTNLREKFQKINLRLWNGGRMISPVNDSLPTFFRSFFPDIKGELTEDHQIFIRAETPLELLEAYEKFFKDPTELYRGLTLSSDYAVDGQEHVVQTKEEFLTFYRDSDKGGN